MTTSLPMTCLYCGLPLREGDRHAVVGTIHDDGSIPITCHVTAWMHNPKRLGIITGISSTEESA